MSIPDSVKSIKIWAFQGCIRLEDLVFHGKTEDEVKSMWGYPWSLKDLSVFKYEP